MKNPLLSVIVPVYNAEQYLHRCLDSILYQAFTDYELLLINDGSTDSSGRICDEYAQKDARIRVIHQENKGVAATREMSIQIAQGTYIQFIDSDDWIEPNTFTVIAEYIADEKYDIVGFDFFTNNNEIEEVIKLSSQTKEDFLSHAICGVSPALWNRTIKRELFIKHDIHFLNAVNIGEDFCISVPLSYYAQSVVRIHQPLYHYNIANESSLIHCRNLDSCYQCIAGMQYIENFLKEKNIAERYKDALDGSKYRAKYPLIKLSPFQWLNIFPEVNEMYDRFGIGKKKRVIVKILLFLDKLF